MKHVETNEKNRGKKGGKIEKGGFASEGALANPRGEKKGGKREMFQSVAFPRKSDLPGGFASEFSAFPGVACNPFFGRHRWQTLPPHSWGATVAAIQTPPESHSLLGIQVE